jgi:hypothetical protein
MNHPQVTDLIIDYLSLIHVHTEIPSSASNLTLRIKSLVSFLLSSLSTLSPLSTLDPNANGVAVLVLVEGVAIFRLILRMNVYINVTNNNSIKPFNILSETSSSLRTTRSSARRVTLLTSLRILILPSWTLEPVFLSFPPRCHWSFGCPLLR